MQAESPGQQADPREKIYNDPVELADLVRKLASQQTPPSSTTEHSAEPPAKRFKKEHSDNDNLVRTGITNDTAAPLTPPRDVPDLPLAQNLYHLAITSRHAASTHLQQAFIPAHVHNPPNSDPSALKALSTSGNAIPFQPDQYAREKAIGLMVLALDALRPALRIRGISERDNVIYSIEFGRNAVDVLRCAQSLNIVIDSSRLHHDAADIVSNGLAIARRFTYMRGRAKQLELLEAKLYFIENKIKLGKRSVKASLLLCSDSEISHRYSLMLVLLEYADPLQHMEGMNVLNELLALAREYSHRDVVSLAQLIRLRLLFLHRRWVDVPGAIDDFGRELDNLAADKPSANKSAQNAWYMHLQLHYLLYRALWFGRSGNDASAKATLKKVYIAMDQAADSGSFDEIRRSGGYMTINLAGQDDLCIRITPPNVTYLMTYLVSVVSRRDYLGSASTCKSLILAKLLRSSEDTARHDDIWDLNFNVMHGVPDMVEIARTVVSIRVEIMLEEVTALMFRGDDMTAERIFAKAILLARDNGVFSDLAPHFCFVYGQYAHLLGRDQSALKGYETCSSLLVPGSEMGLVVDICRMACIGTFTAVRKHPERSLYMRSLVERCKSSSSAILAAACQFMSSFLEENRVASKKKLTTSYEICQQANNNVLRCLIFAFTTSVHMYGTTDKMLRQLETGRDLSRLMGGKDRKDGIGQLALGLWFAEKLKELYRREGQTSAHAAMKEEQQRLLTHLALQKQRVLSIPYNSA